MKFYTEKLLLLLTFMSLMVPAFAQAPAQSLKITHLTGDFYVFTTYRTFNGNPMSSNGLYLLTSEGAVLIDTPWDTTQFQPLLDSIKAKHNKNVVLCIATHSHEDRTGGLDYYKEKGIRTYTSRQTDELCRERGEKRAQHVFLKDTVFIAGAHSIQTFYAGEGHTIDNIVVWFEKDNILYGGCAIKSTDAADLGYVKEANIQAWPATLQKIKKKFSGYKYVIPGHQDWTNNKSIDHTLLLLRQHGK